MHIKNPFLLPLLTMFIGAVMGGQVTAQTFTALDIFSGGPFVLVRKKPSRQLLPKSKNPRTDPRKLKVMPHLEP